MATKLVGYDSGEESENDKESGSEGGHDEKAADLAAEWDNFEKLIAGSSTSDQNYGSNKVDTLHPKPFETVSRKRVFREDSDSDKSDSDDDQYAGFQKTVVSKEHGKDIDMASSSSSSVVSPLNRLESDSDDSSDENATSKKSSIGKKVDKFSKSNSPTSDKLVEKWKNDSVMDTNRRHSSTSSKSSVADTNVENAIARLERRGIATHEMDRDNASKLPTTATTSASSTEDKIRAKLLALADSPPADVDVRKSRSISPSDRRASKHRRSSSPKYRKESRDRGHGRTHRTLKRSRSRSRGRNRRSRSRSRGRHHRNRSRSRSGGRHYKSSRRHHSRDRRSSPPRNRHSRDRRRSRTPQLAIDRLPKNQPLNFKEQMKAQLVNAAQKQEAAVAATTAVAAVVSEVALSGECQPLSNSVAANIARLMANSSILKANEKPSSLPLNMSTQLAGHALGGKDRVTPQQALAQTMAAMHQKAQELTGVAVPSYYNPAAVNPLKYAEQLKKRKLLWSKAPKEETEKELPDVKAVQSVAQWTGSSFAADDDGKMAAKFRKLMGIREEDKILLADNVDISKLSEEQRRRQDELFQQLDKEYAFARMTTHTHRGIGLGFQSQGLPDT